jgi:hypothetical protein
MEVPMKRILTIALPLFLACSRLGVAEAAPAGQFDFLLGQWQLSVQPKATGLVAMIHGTPKLTGSWKAWRAFDGRGVEDEIRIIDASGNPIALNHAMRIYAGSDDSWKISGLDVYRATFSASSGQWRGGEMKTEGSGTDPEGKSYLARTRFINIKADSFTMLQDRSFDDGKTWQEAVLTVEAQRSGPATP